MGDTVYHDWASGAGAGALFEGSDLAIRGASRGKILHYLSNVELVRKVEDLRRQIEILRTDLQRTRQHEACLQKIIDIFKQRKRSLSKSGEKMSRSPTAEKLSRSVDF